MLKRWIIVLFGFIFLSSGLSAETVAHGKKYKRLVIRGATVIEGNGTPAWGPADIVIEGNKIVEVVPLDPVAIKEGEGVRPEGDTEIDAAGKYVLPGLINMHGHAHTERGGKPMPVEYVLKLWLANGITTVRDVGSDTKNTIDLRTKSLRGEIIAPRMYVYAYFGVSPYPKNADEARARIRELKKLGADGIKITGTDRDIMEALEDEAKKLGLRIAHHVGVEETTAWDDIALGTTTIEHWYGIPDAAIVSGRQNFPSTYNYNDEVDRFRYAGRLWREADWNQLIQVLEKMIAAKVAWDPTLVIYEASRDLQRAQTQPWFQDYLHPVLADYFKPDPAHHGSYFLQWSSTDETFWKENYRIWMAALREFEQRGGVITTGEDAGYIYQMYGFGLIRELELHQEAGFHPLKVIQHATGNAAKVLGETDKIGRVRAGHLADLIVVNGNPLENFKVLYPTGLDEVKDGKVIRSGGVEWTIKDGITYHGPTLLQEVKALVDAAKTQ